jgi:NAD(P)-dependent dehydrogenase (short-subunit alcohol dehydrogenase family)
MTCGAHAAPTICPAARIGWTTADMADPAGGRRLRAEARAASARLDILVNNAGVQVEKTVAEAPTPTGTP